MAHMKEFDEPFETEQVGRPRWRKRNRALRAHSGAGAVSDGPCGEPGGDCG